MVMMITMAMTMVIPKCHDSYHNDDDEDIVNGVNANDDDNDIEPRRLQRYRTMTMKETTSGIGGEDDVNKR